MTKEVMKLALNALKNTTPCGFNMETDKRFYSAIEALEKALKQEQDEPWLLNTAQNLAKFMARNFYPEVTHWKVSDNLVSVILQIDNMVTGLIRKSKQEQGEPVAWFRKENGENIYYATKAWDDCLPLYTTPQTKKWVELTNNELVDLTIKNAGFPILLAQAIEAKLKNKNT